MKTTLAIAAALSAMVQAQDETCTGICAVPGSSRKAANMLEMIATKRQAAQAQYGELRKEVEAALPSGPARCIDGMAAGTWPCKDVHMLSRVSALELGSDMGSGAGAVPYDGSDIWGWTDPESGDEFALALLIDMLAVVNVTDPTAPEVMYRMESEPGYTRTTYWRDVKVYENTAYVVADGIAGHGIQVLDLERTRTYVPGSGIIEVEPDFVYKTHGNAHNIFIHEETGYGYSVGSNTCAGGLHVIDLKTDRLKPEFVGCLADKVPLDPNADWASNVGYTHDLQCVVYDGPDTKYTGKEICFGYNEDNVVIYDVTNKTTDENNVLINAPILSVSGGYGNVTFTHQGWITEDSRFMLVDDEGDEYTLGRRTMTYVFDITSLEAPKYLGVSFAPKVSIDHNLYIKGDNAYMSNYQSGLRINSLASLYDGTGPQLKEVAYFETQTNDYPNADFWGAWSSYIYFPSGNIITMDIVNGLFVLSYEPPTAAPSAAPTITRAPSASPTASPSAAPTITRAPSASPTASPSTAGEDTDTASPSTAPTITRAPSASPSAAPSTAGEDTDGDASTGAPSSAPSTSGDDAAEEESEGLSTVAIGLIAGGSAAALLAGGLCLFLSQQRKAPVDHTSLSMVGAPEPAKSY